jgi:hypothetical protein
MAIINIFAPSREWDVTYLIEGFNILLDSELHHILQEIEFPRDKSPDDKAEIDKLPF